MVAVGRRHDGVHSQLVFVKHIVCLACKQIRDDLQVAK